LLHYAAAAASFAERKFRREKESTREREGRVERGEGDVEEEKDEMPDG